MNNTWFYVVGLCSNLCGYAKRNTKVNHADKSWVTRTKSTTYFRTYFRFLPEVKGKLKGIVVTNHTHSCKENMTNIQLNGRQKRLVVWNSNIFSQLRKTIQTHQAIEWDHKMVHPYKIVTLGDPRLHFPSLTPITSKHEVLKALCGRAGGICVSDALLAAFIPIDCPEKFKNVERRWKPMGDPIYEATKEVV